MKWLRWVRLRPTGPESAPSGGGARYPAGRVPDVLVSSRNPVLALPAATCRGVSWRGVSAPVLDLALLLVLLLGGCAGWRCHPDGERLDSPTGVVVRGHNVPGFVVKLTCVQP